MQNILLEQCLNQELSSSAFQDYAPNGLQVEGRPEVRRIVTGVTACQALLEQALHYKADAVLVHHGYFWKNENVAIRGIKRHRLKTLLANDINLYAYHLPLDAHPVLGNNAQLAALLDITVSPHTDYSSLLFEGEFKQAVTADALSQRIFSTLQRQPLHCGDNAPEEIKRIAWCSGGGQGLIELAAQKGVDAFISGEVSEQTIHIAREMGIHFFAAGHHATERYGIKALGEWLQEKYALEVIFVDIDNPA